MRGRKELLEYLPYGVGAEIGVWEGNFSEYLLNKATELHLIDPWLSQPEFEGWAYAGKSQKEMDNMFSRVIERFSDLVTIHRDFSYKVLPKFPDQYFDWIYIDGNHDYDWVKSDIELSLQKAKLVCGDDYQIKSVRKAVNEQPHFTFDDQWVINAI